MFERALKAKPGDLNASDYLGQTLLRLKKYETAETIFQQLVDANPQSGRALLGLGIAQSNLGKYNDALTSLSAAEKASPHDPLVYYYQGLVYHQLRAFDQSPALFSRAMALSPDLTPSARYYTGVAALMKLKKNSRRRSQPASRNRN
ncbi:MAG: tetratricopeptide repeat protein [Nitrospirae bacterium]|nr:MAG: tetratricopeptide repeat protein [Nitrospirota bacterium]